MVYFCSGHFIFSQFPGVAQSCKLGNQGQFVLGPHWNTNLQKNFIGKEISRFMKFQMDYMCSIIVRFPASSLTIIIQYTVQWNLFPTWYAYCFEMLAYWCRWPSFSIHNPLGHLTNKYKQNTCIEHIVATVYAWSDILLLLNIISQPERDLAPSSPIRLCIGDEGAKSLSGAFREMSNLQNLL